jgi:hypothetical protein
VGSIAPPPPSYACISQHRCNTGVCVSATFGLLQHTQGCCDKHTNTYKVHTKIQWQKYTAHTYKANIMMHWQTYTVTHKAHRRIHWQTYTAHNIKCTQGYTDKHIQEHIKCTKYRYTYKHTQHTHIKCTQVQIHLKQTQHTKIKCTQVQIHLQTYTAHTNKVHTSTDTLTNIHSTHK